MTNLRGQILNIRKYNQLIIIKFYTMNHVNMALNLKRKPQSWQWI